MYRTVLGQTEQFLVRLEQFWDAQNNFWDAQQNLYDLMGLPLKWRKAA